MSRTRKSSGAIFGALLIVTGYFIPPPRWAHFTSIPATPSLPQEFLALGISIIFLLSVVGGYTIAANTESKTLKQAPIIAGVLLVSSLIIAIAAGDMIFLPFEVAKSVTLYAAVLLGGFLRV